MECMVLFSCGSRIEQRESIKTDKRKPRYPVRSSLWVVEAGLEPATSGPLACCVLGTQKRGIPCTIQTLKESTGAGLEMAFAPGVRTGGAVTVVPCGIS